jgi:hypothetical protein
MEIFLQQGNRETKLLMQIVTPPFLRYMKFLQYKENGDSQQWLKTSRGVRRLTGANQSDNLFDSDFTVEDFSSIDPALYSVGSLSQADVNGKACYLLELKPRYSDAQYDRKDLYVDRDTYLIRRIDFFSGNNVYKQYMLSETQTVEGKLFPRICTMETLDEGTSTTIRVVDVSVPDSIPTRTFNRGNL